MGYDRALCVLSKGVKIIVANPDDSEIDEVRAKLSYTCPKCDTDYFGEHAALPKRCVTCGTKMEV